jgi:regulator of sigma E protease
MAEIVFFALLLCSLVVVHEGGHLALALACGVRVREIGLGLPPRLLRLGTWRGAALTLNLLPLGGFMLPQGEFDPAVNGGFSGASPGRRACILAAGPIANILLGFGLFTLCYAVGTPDRIRVLQVSAGSPAHTAGILPGDVIVEANGERLRSAEHLHQSIYAHLGSPVLLEIQRRGASVERVLVTKGELQAGEAAAGFLSTMEIVQYSPGEALVRAGREVADLLHTLVAIPLSPLAGRSAEGNARLVGLLGMKQVADQALGNALAWKALFPVLYLAASLSITLGAVNLLPVPALDGGRLALLVPELLLRWRMPPHSERRLHAAGLCLVVALMALLAVRDLAQPLF